MTNETYTRRLADGTHIAGCECCHAEILERVQRLLIEHYTTDESLVDPSGTVDAIDAELYKLGMGIAHTAPLNTRRRVWER